MDWVIVRQTRTRKPIGAIGFLDDKIAVVETFYEDKDWDHDSSVSVIERFGSVFSLEGKALTEVLGGAVGDPDILMRDQTVRHLHGQAVVNFATGMITEGIYAAYFKLSVSKIATGAAAQLARGAAARFFIRKGMENAVKKAYLKANER